MIKDNVQRILKELPAGVQLVAAVKSRSAEEIRQALAAGVKIVGENYVQDAERTQGVIGKGPEWHFIGHLQKNKVKKAVKLFDMVETLDSFSLAEELEKALAGEDKVMPALIEVNCASEEQKNGVALDKAQSLLEKLSTLKHIRVMGLMTMGPLSDDPEKSRPYFRATRQLFEQFKKIKLPNVEMRYLSMGMSGSYRVAVEEGANMVRIGSGIFGPREKK